MEEITNLVASKVAKYLVAPIGRQLGHLFNNHSNLHDLKIQLDQLEYVRGRMERSVDAARRNGEEIEPDVEEWLKSVNGITEKAREILRKDEDKRNDEKDEVKQDVDDSTRSGEEIKPGVEKWLSSVDRITKKAGEDEDKAKKRCLNGLSPNLKSCYQLSKKAKKTTKRVVVEIQDGEKKLMGVSHRPPPLGTIGSARIKDYEDFESRMSTLKKIMEALRNPNINMIGVYGMGGVGKTMLVKEVARRAKEDKLFDEVVMVAVSQTPNIRKIQELIALPLDLRFDAEEIDYQRADRLCWRLKQAKSILIILDAVWAQLDLEAIGIPSGDIHKGCKLVVTSRWVGLSNKMNIQNNFLIKELHQEEAWNLFKKMAGDSVEDHEIIPTALKVAKKCPGLPIAIAVVATALKNKIPSVWEDALVQLEKAAPTTMEGMDERVYSSLKLSYDFLKSGAAQKLFLLCSLLPEDYQFSIQDLLYYGKGFGLFQGIQALEVARNRVHALVEHLKASCLMMDGDTSGLFKMHGVVRDVGIFVAFKYKQMLIVRDEVELEEWMTEEKLRSCSALSLPYTDIHELPTGLESPQLKFFLFFSRSYYFSEIPDSFFGGMKQLKVLTLRNMHFSSLPSSLHLLSSLQTLCLDDCILPDISIIGELKKLEILTLRHSDIEELPREIGQLTRLQLLDLRDCKALVVIPPNVIARLSQLEELYMSRTFNRWEVDGNASLAELKHLSRLVTLEIYIPDPNILPYDLVFEKLTRYRIHIGGDFEDWFVDYEMSRTLFLAVNTSIHLLSGINQLLRRTEDLHLEKLNGFKSILNDSDGEGFHDTRRLYVGSSSEIEYVIDGSVPFSAFPKLESLSLVDLIKLKEICHGQLTAESFCDLRKVKVIDCDRLQNLFPLSVFRRLWKLQKIEIMACKNMDGIVAEGREATEDNYRVLFPQLRSLRLEALPELMSFCSKVKAVPYTSDAGSKESISISEGKHGISIPLFNEKVAFPNLEELDLDHLPRLKAVWMKDSQGSLNFQKLSSLCIHNCESLINIFTPSMMQFQDIVEEINEEEAAEIDKITFPQVKYLTLSRLKQLRIFCQWNHITEWPSLEKLKMSECHNVEIFALELNTFKETRGKANIDTPIKQPLFSVDKVAFPNLEEMELNDMSSMEVIWQGQFHAHSFCKLRDLKVEKCDKILKVFPISLLRNLQNLEELSVKDCCSLEDVFELEGGVGETEQFHTQSSFCKLRVLRVEKCDKILKVFPTSLLRNLQNLEELSIEDCCSLEDLFELQGVGEIEHAVPPLKGLSLIGLPKLMHLWKEDSQLSAVFQNLKTLEVRSCGSLTHVFPSTRAEGPVQTFESTIDASDKGEATDETTFSQLYSLKLKDLPNLTSFCRGGNGFSFPSLEKVFVEECPKLKTCSTNTLRTPKLEKVQVEEGELLWDGNLNTTIQHMFIQKMKPNVTDEATTSKSSDDEASSKSSLPKMEIPNVTHESTSEFPPLKTESPDFTDGATSPSLSERTTTSHSQDKLEDPSSFESLKISDISELKDFPPRLHSLRIEECDTLESLPEEMTKSNCCLEDLYIISCSSLKSLPSRGLPSTLKTLYIRNCRKLELSLPANKVHQCAVLERLCIGSSCDSLKDFPLGSFPELRSLCLLGFPNFESISIAERLQKNLNSLDSLEIRDCPKLKSFPKGGLPATNLTSIWISNCSNLKSLPKRMHTLLPSLQVLSISNCPILQLFPEECLPSNLYFLCITSCNNLTPRVEWGMRTMALLGRFEIEGEYSSVESFPKKGLLPDSLGSLCISGFSNLKHLDYHGLQCLTSLETLEISCCNKLQSFPVEGLPNSLSSLIIKDCPSLKVCCQGHKGVDWPRIAHIPYIEIDQEVIS